MPVNTAQRQKVGNLVADSCATGPSSRKQILKKRERAIRRARRVLVMVLAFLLPCIGAVASSEKGKSLALFAASDPSLEMTGELTLEAWILLDGNSRGGSIIDKSGSAPGPGTPRGGFALEMLSPTTLQFRTAKKESCVLNMRFPPERWTCVTAVYSAERRLFQLFINGKEKADVTTGGFPAMVRNFQPLAIGTGREGPFEGKISRVAIFDRAFNSDEVARRFANPVPCDGEIAGWKITEEKLSRDPMGEIPHVETLVGRIPLGKSPPRLQLKGLAPQPADPLCLWYRKPAENWGEAMPLGNGRLGMMMFGRLERERIALNEGSFWSGGPHDYSNPGALQNLQQARPLVFGRRYVDVDDLLSQSMQGNPSTQCSFQPIGDLIFDLPPTNEIINNYCRELNLEQGLARVSYSQAGISYTREGFVSAVDQVGVIRWSADQPGHISFSVRFGSQQQTAVEVENNEMLVVHGNVPASRSKISNKLQFVTRIKVVPTGGEMQTRGNSIEVRNANSVIILLDTATNYRNYHDITADPDAITHDRLSRASGRPFEQLFAAHLAKHKRLFNRVSFQLGGGEIANNKPTDERLRAFTMRGGDLALIALYFQFGRYALLSSSRPGGQPATISGIWNENPFPEKDSKYLLHGPTLMAYWLAEAANLPECLEPVTRLCRQLSETGARTAALMYGAGGWACFASTDLWRGSAPSDGTALYSPVCGAALASLLWKHFLYTGDKQYLFDSYPILKSASQFFLDSLQQEPRRGWWMMAPTVSPGSVHPPGAFSAAGSTFDSSVLRELFKSTAEAAEILNTDPEFREQLRSLCQKLPPLQVNTSGRLQPWPKDWPISGWESLHSLYGLFPSGEISPWKHFRLAAAAKKSLENTGDSGPPWAEAWRACLWARLGEGDHAWKSLKRLLQPSKTSPNFLGDAPGFHLSGMWGATSAILEMLLQNENDEIHLLPALPTAWPQGSIHGLRARDGFEIDLDWKEGRLTQTWIHSSLGRVCKVRYKDKIISFPTEKGRSYRLDGTLCPESTSTPTPLPSANL